MLRRPEHAHGPPSSRWCCRFVLISSVKRCFPRLAQALLGERSGEDGPRKLIAPSTVQCAALSRLLTSAPLPLWISIPQRRCSAQRYAHMHVGLMLQGIFALANAFGQDVCESLSQYIHIYIYTQCNSNGRYYTNQLV